MRSGRSLLHQPKGNWDSVFNGMMKYQANRIKYLEEERATHRRERVTSIRHKRPGRNAGDDRYRGHTEYAQ